MADACPAGRKGDHSIVLFKIRSIGDQKNPVDIGQRLGQRTARIVEVPNMDVNLIVKQSFGSLRAANENGRARPGVNEPLCYP